LDLKKNTFATLNEEINEARAKQAEAKAEWERQQKVLLNTLKEAKTATGLEPNTKDKPPRDLMAYWDEQKFPECVDEIDQLAGQLDAQALCTENQDISVLDKYTRLKEKVQELEQEVQRKTKDKNSLAKKIGKVKDQWLEGLNSLISEINTRFAHNFEIMGFAGAVELFTGKHENDFDNYGIKILVKYRNTEPLQELTPYHQSGGERSVATAIYMLSLQALTTVPFRCVDEINQGMDARNERLIFKLLVETSCCENNAQYFLLTPKLLTGLDYNPRMNVLCVHNGPGMLHHTEFDLDKFCG